ncbi:MAG TPA: hypothetical protein PK093_00180 [Phycisphaerae bacterium]|nr:hypothetical protein [Phycisphaerae bacterium]
MSRTFDLTQFVDNAIGSLRADFNTDAADRFQIELFALNAARSRRSATRDRLPDGRGSVLRGE